MEGDDEAEIRKATDELSQASHKLAEKLYSQKTEGGQAEGQGQPNQQPGDQKGSSGDDDVVDADYTEVKDKE